MAGKASTVSAYRLAFEEEQQTMVAEINIDKGGYIKSNICIMKESVNRVKRQNVE